MRQLTRVTMSMRELDRLKCIQALADGDLPAYKAAERLGITTRQLAAADRVTVNHAYDPLAPTCGPS
jgi:hypothetical protein